MAYSVIEMLNSQMPTVQKTVDLTISTLSSNGQLILPGMPDPALDMFFPMQSYLALEVALMKMRESRPTLANIIAIDGEVPTDTVPLTLTTEVIGSLKIGKARVFTEEDFNMMYKLQMLLATAPQAAQQILDHLMQTPITMTMGLRALMRRMSLLIAVTGKALYTDPITGIATTSLDYTAQIPSGHLAATKTGNARWSQSATANPIGDLVAHAQAYFDNLKRWPAYVIMGRTEANNLRLAATTKEIVARTKGIITDSGTVDPAAIASILPPSLTEISAAIAQQLTGSDGASPGTMTLIVSDSTWEQRNADGTATTGSYIPSGYYLFASPGYIEEAMTPIASNNFAGGISIQTDRLVPSEPRRELLTVATGYLPLCVDPRLIAARNVENTALAA